MSKKIDKMKQYLSPLTAVLVVENESLIMSGSGPEPVAAPNRASVAPMTSIAGKAWV